MVNSKQRGRAPWWMYVTAAVFLLTLLFNARQEAVGPAMIGWTPSWPTLKVARVVPGGLMDKAGMRAGDLPEAADGKPLTGMPDWFVARAHFERDRPIEIQVRRGEQHLGLRTVISAPGFRAWPRMYYLNVIGLYLARVVLLILAIVVAFSRPQQRTARLAAMMLAVGAVADGYPTEGWAAALRHFPAVLAMPICLASISCLLAATIWLQFCASFPRPWLSQRKQWALALVPVAFFGPLIVASAVAMIYSPASLARPWPAVLSAGAVRFIQSTAGVTPLLFLSVLPFYGPLLHARLLELWLAFSILYFSTGFLMLTANYLRLKDSRQKQRTGALCIAFTLFGLIVLHNVFIRNWPGWFHSAPPPLFSGVTFAAEAVVFLIVPLTLAWCVMAEPGGGSYEGEIIAPT